MSARFSIKLSSAGARNWAEQMAERLRQLPETDARRIRMIERCEVALKRCELFCIDYAEGCAVMAPTNYARSLLIEARSWA